MPKQRTTISLTADTLRAVRLAAARTGRHDSEVIEDAVRAHLGLDVFEQLWERADLSADEAMALALEAQRSGRTAT